MIPKLMLLYNLFVDLFNRFSNEPPEKALKPSSRETIPNKNIETPKAIVLNSELTQSPYDSIIKMVGKNNFFSTLLP
jgi:hypothetical protein